MENNLFIWKKKLSVCLYLMAATSLGISWKFGIGTFSLLGWKKQLSEIFWFELLNLVPSQVKNMIKF